MTQAEINWTVERYNYAKGEFTQVQKRYDTAERYILRTLDALKAGIIGNDEYRQMLRDVLKWFED